MRATVDIDDGLLEALRRRLPASSDRDAVETAIRAYLANDATEQLRKLAGSFDIVDASKELRRGHR